MEELLLSISVKRIFVFFRMFGLAVGLTSTAYFIFAFWLIFQGSTVNFFETNTTIASLELLMAVTGFIVLFSILLMEVVRWR